MNKHTNFTNEITATYHNARHWTDYLYMTTGIALLVVMPFIIAGYIWGAESVTDFIASLWI